MNKIGFKNFRRFVDFPLLEYSGITFLVGRNNAGKSTLVKALLLINDFLKSGNVNTFSFGNNVLEDANIVTYGRARNRTTKENYIEFDYQLDDYFIKIQLSGDDDKTIAQVHYFEITNTANGISFQFSPVTSEVTISREQSKISRELSDDALAAIEDEIQRYNREINLTELKKSSKQYINLINELKALSKKRQLLVKEKDKRVLKPGYSVHTFYHNDMTSEQTVSFAIGETLYLHDEDFKKSQSGKKPSKDFANYRGFKEDAIIVEKTFAEFYDKVKAEKIIYLGANPAKQSALFSIRDTNNALAQSIHQFHQLKISQGEPAYQFVLRWMEEFEVGSGFKIAQIAGEAYEVTIQSHRVSIPLADKGMGSIQAMLLILRLATIIHKTTIAKEINPTIVIEEPELNLHPALQSKLADLFLNCYEQFNMNFIIETHSEYIIRRSQVLVIEKEFEVAPNENPYCAHYFPKDLTDNHYRLRYNSNGTFDKNFGTGFFDEASASTLTLLRLQRQKQ